MSTVSITPRSNVVVPSSNTSSTVSSPRNNNNNNNGGKDHHSPHVSYHSLFPPTSPGSPSSRPSSNSGIVTTDTDVSSRRMMYRPPSYASLRVNTAPSNSISSPRTPLSNSKRNVMVSSPLVPPSPTGSGRSRGRPLEVTFGNNSEYTLPSGAEDSQYSNTTIEGRRKNQNDGVAYNNHDHSWDTQDNSHDRPSSERRNRVGSHFILNNLDPSIKSMFRDVIRARAALLTIILGTQVTYKHLTAHPGDVVVNNGNNEGSISQIPPNQNLSPAQNTFTWNTLSDIGFSPSQENSLTPRSPFTKPKPSKEVDPVAEFMIVSQKALSYDKMKLEQLVIEALNTQQIRWKEIDKVELNKFRAKEYEIQQHIIERNEEEKRQLKKDHKQVIDQLQKEKTLLINQIIRLKTVLQGMKEPFIFVPPDERKAMNESLAKEIQDEAERSIKMKKLGVEGMASHAVKVIEESQAEVSSNNHNNAVQSLSTSTTMFNPDGGVNSNNPPLDLSNHDETAGPAMEEIRGELTRLRSELASTQDTLTLQQKLMGEVVQQNDTLQKQISDVDNSMRLLVQERDTFANTSHKLTEERDALLQTIKELENKLRIFNTTDNSLLEESVKLTSTSVITNEEEGIIAAAAEITIPVTVETSESLPPDHVSNSDSTNSPTVVQSVTPSNAPAAMESSMDAPVITTVVNDVSETIMSNNDGQITTVEVPATPNKQHHASNISPRAGRNSAFQTVYPSPRPVTSPLVISTIPALQSKLAHVQKEKAAAEGEAERYRLELLETRTQLQVLETLHGELTVEAAVHLALAQGGSQDKHSTVSELVRSRSNSRPGTANKTSLPGTSKVVSRPGTANNTRPCSANTTRSIIRNRSGSTQKNKVYDHQQSTLESTDGHDMIMHQSIVQSSTITPGQVRPLTASRTAQLTAVAIKVTERDRLRKEVARLTKHSSILEHTINNIQKEREGYEETIQALQRENRILNEQMKLSDARYDEMRKWLDIARKQARHGAN